MGPSACSPRLAFGTGTLLPSLQPRNVNTTPFPVTNTICVQSTGSTMSLGHLK